MPLLSRFHNVRTALIVFVLLPFVLVMVIGGWFSLRNLEADLRAQMEEDIELIARSVRLPLGYALEKNDDAFLEKVLLSTGDIGRVYGIYVYDEDGNRVARSGARKAIVGSEKAATLVSTGDQQSGFDDAEGEPMFSYFVPLADSHGELNGLLQVSRRGKEFTEHVSAFRKQVLTAVILYGLLLIAAIYFGYYFSLGRHLQSVQKSMAEIATQGPALRIAPRGPQEVRALAECVNDMLDGIARSEHVLAQQRLREFELKARLQQHEKLAAIGRLAAGVAHELGTPLSVADGKAQRALRTAEGTQAQALTDIRAQLGRMTQIIRQLMEFARPATPNYRRFSVAGLVHSAVGQMEEMLADTNLQLQVIPEPQDAFIEGNRMRLEQALVNLLRNAIQAAPNGQVSIGWQTTPSNKNVIIRVDDSGPGIDQNIADRLFEPFVTSKSGSEGIGLGLAVVSSIAFEHRGRIDYQPSPLGGARFSLTLPNRPSKGTLDDE
ncbi:MAG TPA: ATP-binding protein [Marinagarivorans sp.]